MRHYKKERKKYEIFNTSFMAYHLQHIQTEEDTSIKWLNLTGVSSRERERENCLPQTGFLIEGYFDARINRMF